MARKNGVNGKMRCVVKLIATGETIATKLDPVKKLPVPAISGQELVPPFLGSPV